MKKNKIYLVLISFLALLPACKKDLLIKAPKVKQPIVVLGSIQQNSPPIVILKRTAEYFQPGDYEALERLFIHNGIVTINDGSNTCQLNELHSFNLPDSTIHKIATLAGLTSEELRKINYCFYTTSNPAAFGKLNHSYHLKVKINDTLLTATTTIPKLIPPDSLWFKLFGNNDFLGYLYFSLQDPPGKRNAWRVFTKRLHKDARFIPARNATFDDQNSDGKKISFHFIRGMIFNSQKPDDNNEESGFYKIGDTIAVKFYTIDETSYKFWNSVENKLHNSGTPFASSSKLKSNINGGLGVWCGYAAVYDTVIAK